MNWYLHCWKKCLTFSGRARRKEYWMFVLCNGLLTGGFIALTIVVAGTCNTAKEFAFNDYTKLPDSLVFISSAIAAIFLFPFWSLSVRRLHDLNLGGWWLVIQWVPFVGFIPWLVLTVLRGTRGANRYGEDPREERSDGEYEQGRADAAGECPMQDGERTALKELWGMILSLCLCIGSLLWQPWWLGANWFCKSAELGDAAVQYNNLGLRYANGEGVERSSAEAVKWYRKSAEQGDAAAQFNLGACYYNGEGVEGSFSEAAKWYRKAAVQGDAAAQVALGVCYVAGTGVERSFSEAAKWYRKAAEQGDVAAQVFLGLHYANGLGVEQSKSEAAKWFRRAAQNGYELSDEERKIADEY